MIVESKTPPNEFTRHTEVWGDYNGDIQFFCRYCKATYGPLSDTISTTLSNVLAEAARHWSYECGFKRPYDSEMSAGEDDLGYGAE